ncbi:hypothetical protein ACVIJW_009905 [Bradyrhizobium barranii subsp. barranii]
MKGQICKPIDRRFVIDRVLKRLAVHQRGPLVAVIASELFEDGSTILLCAFSERVECGGLIVAHESGVYRSRHRPAGTEGGLRFANARCIVFSHKIRRAGMSAQPDFRTTRFSVIENRLSMPVDVVVNTWRELPSHFTESHSFSAAGFAASTVGCPATTTIFPGSISTREIDTPALTRPFTALVRSLCLKDWLPRDIRNSR